MRQLSRALGGVAGLAEVAVGRLPGAAQSWVIGETAHRPWPLPDGPWVMAQAWEDLLFAHWRVPADVMRPLVPEPLALDTFDGSAWLGVTPFELSGLRLRGTPPVPRLSRFPELNVRTYATFDGHAGIWFFSLDAGSSAAVAGARATYRLPYFRAAMGIERTDSRIRYRSVRGAARLDVEYAPMDTPEPPVPGTLEHWLVERYCLYVVDPQRRVLRADIHHPPWPLQPAIAEFAANTMAPAGVELAGEPLLHFARRQDVLVWPLRSAQ